MDTVDVLEDEVFTPNSKYYTAKEFNSAFDSNKLNKYNYFSLMHLNIRSLQKNFDTLSEFLNQINSYPFSIIGLTETWLHSATPPIFEIDNYTLEHIDRKQGKGGGVAFYIHNNLKYKLRRDICVEGIESMFIEITVNNIKNRIVGILYRPPNNVVDVFLDRLESCLEAVSRENKEIFIMGDFNIDISLPHTAQGQSFINLLSSYTFIPLIDKPTRTTASTHTIILKYF